VNSVVGIVIIGRNEGDRLRRCLAIVKTGGAVIVYVDSGSMDGSVELAREMGADVVELDPSFAFTAARARNEGFHRVLQLQSDIEFVQFVDGDCELSNGWIERGVAELRLRQDVAVVFGRVRERSPESSIYNRLCDMEWDGQPGEVRACGGIAMIRAASLRQVNGYDPSLIAGEEPELCLRLRRAGWKVLRVDADMTWHDAAITHFGQWWRRAVRAGHAYAEGAWLHGCLKDRYNLRPVASMIAWAAVLPATALLLTWPSSGLSLGLFLLYPLQWIRIVHRQHRTGRAASESRLYALFTILSKFAGLAGALRFPWSRLLGRRNTLIEYKSLSPRESDAGLRRRNNPLAESSV